MSNKPDDVAALVERLFWSHERPLTVKQAHAAAEALEAQAAEIDSLHGRLKAALDLAERHMDEKHTAQAKLKEATDLIQKLYDDPYLQHVAFISTPVEVRMRKMRKFLGGDE